MMPRSLRLGIDLSRSMVIKKGGQARRIDALAGALAPLTSDLREQVSGVYVTLFATEISAWPDADSQRLPLEQLSALSGDSLAAHPVAGGRTKIADTLSGMLDASALEPDEPTTVVVLTDGGEYGSATWESALSKDALRSKVAAARARGVIILLIAIVTESERPRLEKFARVLGVELQVHLIEAAGQGGRSFEAAAADAAKTITVTLTGAEPLADSGVPLSSGAGGSDDRTEVAG